MKKMLFIIAPLCFLLLIGCGKGDEKTLVCTQGLSGVDVAMNIGFKGNAVKSIDFNYTMDIKGFTDEQIKALEKEDLCSIVKSSMIGYTDAFNNCKTKTENDKYVMSANLDINKISDASLKNDSGISDAKKGLESQGFTCKEQ